MIHEETETAGNPVCQLETESSGCLLSPGVAGRTRSPTDVKVALSRPFSLNVAQSGGAAGRWGDCLSKARRSGVRCRRAGTRRARLAWSVSIGTTQDGLWSVTEAALVRASTSVRSHKTPSRIRAGDDPGGAAGSCRAREDRHTAALRALVPRIRRFRPAGCVHGKAHLCALRRSPLPEVARAGREFRSTECATPRRQGEL